MKKITLTIAALLLTVGLSALWAAESTTQPTTQPAATGDLEPLALQLPKPKFEGTPKQLPPGSTVERNSKARPPFLAPKGTKNVALDKTVTSSDAAPIVGEIKLVTDGDKEAAEGSYVELSPGLQWVQIDLGEPYEISAIIMWHFHLNARVYKDVVVQAADDADFITNVRTLFNNDQDNSSGLGVGKDREYFDTYEGKLIDAKSTKARYLRFYSKGSTADESNHYTEIEVYALPKK